MFAVYMGATVRGKVSVAISATLLGLLQLLLHLRSLQGSDLRRNGAPSFVRVCFALFLFFFLHLVESAGGLSLLMLDRLCSETGKLVDCARCGRHRAVRSESSEHTITYQVSVVIVEGLATTLQVSKKLRYSRAALKTHSVWGFR